MQTVGETLNRKENDLSNWSTEQKLDLMWKRFVHDDAWFAKQRLLEEGDKPHIAYFPVREGVCTHTPKHKRKNCPDVHKVVFNKQYLLDHLQAKATYAPYQVSRDDTVKWLCLDIDYGDQTASLAISLAREIYKMFGDKKSLIEFSGSKGHHVWVFFDEPIPAGYALSLGHALSQRVDIPEGGVIEIYPKQNSRKLLGSTVKLPLGIHQKTGNRCMFKEPTKQGLVQYEDQWKALNDVIPLSSKMIMERFAEFESERPKERINPEPAPACLLNIMENGISEGFRDEPTFKIACYLRAKGLPEDMALSSLQEWNQRNRDPLDEEQLETKVESAYSSDYSYLPCSSPLFDHACISTCPFYKHKERLRWRNKNKSSIGVLCKE